jgi:hypothetical protein
MLAGLAAAAADPGSGSDFVQWALNQGGAFIVALVTGYGWWRAEKRADAERTSRDALAQQFMDKVIPALEQSTTALREFVIAAASRNRGPDNRGRN